MPDTCKQPRIYVVDDEPVIALTLEMILSKQGFNTISFTSPLAALQAAQTAPPDVLVSDVVMPELNGIELAVRVKRRHPACQVLLISGEANTIDLVDEARKRGGHNFEILAKPVLPSVVIDKIRAMTEPWHLKAAS